MRLIRLELVGTQELLSGRLREGHVLVNPEYVLNVDSDKDGTCMVWVEHQGGFRVKGTSVEVANALDNPDLRHS